IEGQALHGLAALLKAEGDLPGAARLVLESTRLLSSTGDHRSLIGNAELLAEICVAHGHPAGAVTLIAAAQRNRTELEAHPTPQLEEELDELSRAAQAALSESELQQALETGHRTKLDALARRISIIAREITGRQQPLPELLAADDADDTQPDVDYNLTA